jgi:hypothetical protein
MSKAIADALYRSLQSENVLDSQGQTANVVDVLQFVAGGCGMIAQAIDRHTEAMCRIADAIDLLSVRTSHESILEQHIPDSDLMPEARRRSAKNPHLRAPQGPKSAPARTSDAQDHETARVSNR